MRFLFLLGLVLCLSAACSAKDGPIVESTGEEAAGARPGEPSASAGAEISPLYVLLSTFETAEDRIGYFATTGSIDQRASVDVRHGIEEPGGGRLYVERGIGTFMIGGGETPTLTRYDVAADGSLTPGSVLSFANQGVSDLADGAVVFASASKAYFRDRSQVQLIAFDPTRMESLDTFPLEGLERPGFTTDFGQSAIERPDGIYFPMMWYDEGEDSGPPGAALVRIVPETDEVEVTSDPAARA